MFERETKEILSHHVRLTFLAVSEHLCFWRYYTNGRSRKSLSARDRSQESGRGRARSTLCLEGCQQHRNEEFQEYLILFPIMEASVFCWLSSTSLLGFLVSSFLFFVHYSVASLTSLCFWFLISRCCLFCSHQITSWAVFLFLLEASCVPHVEAVAFSALWAGSLTFLPAGEVCRGLDSTFPSAAENHALI